ncbi:conserved hypothetical protein [Pediculus humanus corporis]|uniref:C2H2-type domain-containing protein n=1 Tax=Pediculus humanus subsp. corporis TaxID=121224 RepID=E0VTC1_PEDHC|nr:uncharacterized protein Phum_PHUM430410 [Pediculus humanus corporis]EEB16627.1 conserved hypothetical protein [Pediculus humanus corporis]
MNFSPFGSHFPTTIPTIHQFAAKFTHDSTNGVLGSGAQNLNDAQRYHSSPGPAHFGNQHHPPLGMPVNMGKYAGRNESINTQSSQMSNLNATNKYISLLYNNSQNLNHQSNRPPANSPNMQQSDRGSGQLDKRYDLQPQDLCSGILNDKDIKFGEGKNFKKEDDKDCNERPHSNETEYNSSMGLHHTHHQNQMPPSWQSLAAPGSTVADYLSHLPASTLPLSLHHFLKYSAESIKKETDNLSMSGLSSGTINNQSLSGSQGSSSLLPPAKKKKKKKPKEKKPRPKPGEIRLTTALDGSTLYCCPECHMAYPEKEMLEQHLLGHTLERRFVCDICGAGLKRKDHLTRHKQSHNPERPFVCSVCLKAFKRKEQLTLHFVIHSGEKRHVCPECGKGFYRKDHLRKHTRSHIARRVKAELSQHAPQAQQHPGSLSSSHHIPVETALLS